MGATAPSLMKLVLRDGVRIAARGLAAGLLGALLLAKFLGTLLFRVRPFEPLTYVGVASVLTAVVLMACWWPARQAARVDPMEALRSE